MSLLDTVRNATTFAPRKPLEIGDYTVTITEASYGEGQTKGKYRVLVKVQVSEGDFAGSLANLYISFGGSEDQTARNLKPWVDCYLANGGNADRLEQDAESLEEIGANLAAALTVGIRKGIKFEGIMSIRPNPKDESRPYKNFSFAAPTYAPTAATPEQLAAFAAAA